MSPLGQVQVRLGTLHEIHIDRRGAHLVELRRAPAWCAVLVDQSGTDAFDEIVASQAGERRNVFLLQTRLQAAQKPRLAHGTECYLQRCRGLGRDLRRCRFRRRLRPGFQGSENFLDALCPVTGIDPRARGGEPAPPWAGSRVPQAASRPHPRRCTRAAWRRVQAGRRRAGAHRPTRTGSRPPRPAALLSVRHGHPVLRARGPADTCRRYRAEIRFPPPAWPGTERSVTTRCEAWAETPTPPPMVMPSISATKGFPYRAMRAFSRYSSAKNASGAAVSPAFRASYTARMSPPAQSPRSPRAIQQDQPDRGIGLPLSQGRIDGADHGVGQRVDRLRPVQRDVADAMPGLDQHILRHEAGTRPRAMMTRMISFVPSRI